MSADANTRTNAGILVSSRVGLYLYIMPSSSTGIITLASSVMLRSWYLVWFERGECGHESPGAAGRFSALLWSEEPTGHGNFPSVDNVSSLFASIRGRSF